MHQHMMVPTHVRCRPRMNEDSQHHRDASLARLPACLLADLTTRFIVPFHALDSVLRHSSTICLNSCLAT